MVRRSTAFAPGLLALLVTACGGPQQLTRTERAFVAGAIHDPAREWAAARPQLPPVRERRRGPQLIRRPGAIIYGPDRVPELRPFARHEWERISRLQPVVLAASRAHDVPTDMINGIIWVESKFVRRARSPVGACSLMQIMPRTGRELASQLGRRYEPWDPDFNVHAGTFYFAWLVERYEGNLRLALAAYNIGPGTVDGWLRRGERLAERSERYVDNVFTAARAFRARGL
ncbi:MAG: lytic transglycosylase domain-containing protein [Myxococcales bacterium]|jgi:soluble lytic murein transglycosylase-like protein